MQHSQYYSTCNNTKWLELRALFLSIEAAHRPKYRSRCIANGYVSEWDGEWYYHFNGGGLKDIEWVELKFKPIDCTDMFRGLLEIGLVGELRDNHLRIYGYVPKGLYSRRLTEEDLSAMRV